MTVFFKIIAIICGFRPDGRKFWKSGLYFGVKNDLTHWETNKLGRKKLFMKIREIEKKRAKKPPFLVQNEEN